MLPLLYVAAGAGLFWWLAQKDHPKVFISFAVEDERYRDYLVGQAKNEKTPFKLKDSSLHEPFSNAWKTQTREIIQGSDVLVCMIGKDTYRAEGALWEIQAALEEGIPVIGVHVNKAPKGRVPRPLKGHPVIAWTHNGIARAIKKAVDAKRADD